jgi:hypothetical protein
MKTEILKFFKISEFSLIDDEVQVFRINIKLLSNPVAELKIRENDSHCRSIVLKTMDRSIVKQLEKEKNSNFNVENFVVRYNNFPCCMNFKALGCASSFKVHKTCKLLFNLYIIHFSDVTLLFEQWIIFKNLQFYSFVLEFTVLVLTT